MKTGVARIDNIINMQYGMSLESEIGRGKYGVVYMGKEESTGKYRAVKVISLPNQELEEQLRDTYGDDNEKIEDVVREMAFHFENEIKAMQELGKQTSGVIKMYDHILNQDGIYFDLIITMELAKPLKNYLKQGQFSIRDVIKIGYETAAGLGACHENGIIHRDIKEDNLFLDANNHVKIGDFGVANISDGLVINKTMGIGTPHYMAPELKNSENGNYDNRVDIYSLGIVMYLLCNNNLPPFVETAHNSQEAYERRMKGETIPPPENGNDELNKIILKCCAYNPDDRYRDVKNLINDLKSLENNLSDDELNRILPYPKRETSANEEWWNKHLSPTAPVFDLPEKDETFLTKTIDILNSIIKRKGKDNPDGELIRSIYGNVSVAGRELDEAERKLARMKKILIGIAIFVVVIIATTIMLYPQSATFYSNIADEGKVYVKYLFFPEKKLTEESAAYLSFDGKNLFFSGRGEKHHALYKANIWTGETTLLDENECEYDVPIGDYIYYTIYNDKEKLYRIKKDGTEKKCLVEYTCRDLKNQDGSLYFKIMNTDTENILDVRTIK